MIARVRRAMARFEHSIWGDALGVVVLFAGLWLGLWLPLVIGGW